MQLKDHYKTLGIQPTASMQQVKKSFRQLAHQYHPDKNPGSAIAEATFREVQEAYEILGDAEKREEYNYKRWYSRSVKESFVQESLSPENILRECRHLYNYLQSVNAMRINFDGLSNHIRQLLSEKNIGILQQENDENINTQVIDTIIGCSAILHFTYTEPIALLLRRIAGNNAGLAAHVANFMQQQKQQNAWQQYKIVLVIALTALLCWIIYMVSQ